MDIFHGFCPKIELSIIAVFHRNYVRKDPFWIFKSETIIKRPENEVKTMAKKWTFFKRVVHGFCPKIELSLIAVFHRNYVRKDHFWIF